MDESPKKFWLVMLAVVLVTATISWLPIHNEGGETGSAAAQSSALPASEFSRLIREFSEEGGFFHSDNFTSNETAYLNVVDKLHELVVSGGAYIGVGPEQNFTYIAKIKPRIAFIVDIRRQAMIQQLLYKAVFVHSGSRAQFLAELLSRPLTRDIPPSSRASIYDLLDYFRRAPASNDSFTRNLSRVRNTIEAEFGVPLSARDKTTLEYVFKAFRDNGVSISFRSGNMGWRGYSQFPTLESLILQTDQHGRLGNFLASDDDYRLIRRMQLRNRIIPIVGDFAGTKALASVGRYLARNGYTVSAFYTSNVEQFLFQNGAFGSFVANVRYLPVDDKSVFIRSVSRMGPLHPAHIPGFRSTTLLQKISVFLRDQNTRLYQSYWELTTTHYISGDLR